jgi:pimeloyl-ACP methyl ester carboxylesterase
VPIEYEVVGEGRPWVITPGGRFSKDSPGVRELAAALAERGNRVLIWDRPNCGASDVCFFGPSESAMQADILAELLVDLDMAPAVIAGGSGGSRVSLLTAARHREVAAGLAMWWISGGVYGLLAPALQAWADETARHQRPDGPEPAARVRLSQRS